MELEIVRYLNVKFANTWVTSFSTLLSDIIFLLALGALFSIYLIYKVKNGRKIFLALALSLAIFFSLDFILKTVLPFRPRPYLQDPNLSLFGYPYSSSSFPSGHVAGITAFVTVLALWSKKYWVFIVAIIAILLMAFFRLVNAAHYPSDLLGGLLVGLLSAIIALTIIKR